MDEISKNIKDSNENTKFSALYNSITEGIIYFNTNKSIISINPAAIKILGLNGKKGIQWKDIQAKYVLLDRQKNTLAEEELPHIVALKTGQNVKEKLIGFKNKKDNSVKWLSVGAIPQKIKGSNDFNEIFITLSDVTIRKRFDDIIKQKHEELKNLSNELESKNKQILEKQAMFESLIKAMPSGIGILDKNKFSFLNNSLCQIVGYEKHDLLNKSPSILFINKKEYDEINKQILSQIDKEGVSTIQTTWKTKVGKIIEILLSSAPIDIEDRSKGITFTATDITQQVDMIKELEKQSADYLSLNLDYKKKNEELKEKYEELSQTKEKAQESDRLKSVFLANISHEIRTPLNGIIGFSSLLCNDKLNISIKKKYQKILTQSADQLLRIIEDIMDISMIESDQIVIQTSEFELNELIRNIYTFHKRELMEKQKIEIEFDYYTDLPDNQCKIKSDHARLRQVLNNLIDNAIKYTDKGKILFGYYVKENELEFFVEDTGIGIPANMHSIIFERFRQVEEGSTRNYGGAGLGLPICKGIVQNMIGRIWVESVLDKGSTFYFSIPKNIMGAKPQKQEKKESKMKHPDWTEKIILVVEDDELNFEFIKAVLSSTNAGLIHTLNGEEAIEICKNMAIDLILMDIRLPNIDGYEASKQIRELGLKIPILAQTAYAMPGDDKKCLESGCNDYISKPLNPNVLFEKIKKLFADKE